MSIPMQKNRRCYLYSHRCNITFTPSGLLQVDQVSEPFDQIYSAIIDNTCTLQLTGTTLAIIVTLGMHLKRSCHHLSQCVFTASTSSYKRIGVGCGRERQSTPHCFSASASRRRRVSARSILSSIATCMQRSATIV